MIDTKHIGLRLPTVSFEVEKGRLRFFAKATGETRPEYLDESAARAAGYRSLPAPPTFLMGADLDAGTMTTLLETLNVPIGRILHGEQSFTYHAPVCAGDVLSVESKISDIYGKKSGALEFIVKDSLIKDATGETVLEARSVIVVRNPQENAARTPPLVTRSRSARRFRHSSFRPSRARRWHCSPAPRVTTTRSTLTSTLPRPLACRTCSRTACCRWPIWAAF